MHRGVFGAVASVVWAIDLRCIHRQHSDATLDEPLRRLISNEGVVVIKLHGSPVIGPIKPQDKTFGLIITQEVPEFIHSELLFFHSHGRKV